MIERVRGIMLATAVLVAGWGVSCASGDPFAGEWKLNIGKSNLPAPVPQSETVRIRISDQIIRLQEDFVSSTGEQLTVKVHAKFDGQDYAVEGSPFADTVAYTRVDPNTIKGRGKKGSKVIMDETAVVSENGRTLTSTYSGVDASGRPGTYRAVFDRH